VASPPTPTFLEAISAGDLGVFLANEDFIGVQSMRERFTQTLSYRRAFGSDVPVIRSKLPGDETTVSFSFILLKQGYSRGLNRYAVLKAMQDFEISTRKGEIIETYQGCNWTSIDIDSGVDTVTVNVDVSVPNFVP